MPRCWPTWLAFTLCLAVVLGAMGWVSRAVLRLEQERRQAQRSAAFEDNVRLALWRMDSAVAPLLAEESARPHIAYRAFYEPRDTAASGMAPGRLVASSPLLREPPDHVLVYFQFDGQDRLTSPQVPDATWRELAIPKFTSAEAVARAEQRLVELGKQIDRTRLVALLPAQPTAPAEWVLAPLVPPEEQQSAMRERRANLTKQGRAAVEFDQRSQAVLNVAALSQQQQQAQQPQFDAGLPEAATTDLGGATMTPAWIDGQLLLARRMHVEGSQVVQGCLLDWPAIRQSLLESVADLLPEADLLPVNGPDDDGHARRLAALPARVVAGPPPSTVEEPASALQLSLLIAWACALLAAAAVAGLLWGVMQLSERRAAFVSAVTHELRTPLTTFQMYAEMLADGMVTGESQRAEYLATLRQEASRLIHLVENVLSYARLERGRVNHRLERLTTGELLDRVVPRLVDRARQAGMELRIETPAPVTSAVVCTNPGVVEQILFNLVDNACKYARHAKDRRIHLAAQLGRGQLELTVRDHGPGVAAGAARRLFRPFSKSARDAAESAPGVGVGLALSRRLARQLGGELSLVSADRGGAAFVLSLRRE